MLQLNITTRPIRLDYNLQNAQLKLKTTPPKVGMETIPPQLEIRQARGELTIDSTPYYYSIGRKNLAAFARDNAELGRQTVLKTIARIVEDGNQLADITNNVNMNVIAELAVKSKPLKDGEIEWTPIAAPEIRYQMSPAQITVIPGRIDYNPQMGTVQGDYQPGKVDIRVIQYPSVEITTVDVKV